MSQWVLIDLVQSGHSAGKLPGFAKVGASEASGNIESGSIGKSAPTSELAVSICGSDCVIGLMVGVAVIFGFGRRSVSRDRASGVDGTDSAGDVF